MQRQSVMAGSDSESEEVEMPRSKLRQPMHASPIAEESESQQSTHREGREGGDDGFYDATELHSSHEPPEHKPASLARAAEPKRCEQMKVEDFLDSHSDDENEQSCRAESNASEIRVEVAMNDESLGDSASQPSSSSKLQSLLDTFKSKDKIIVESAVAKPDTEITFGDFTESELRAKMLAKRVLDIKQSHLKESTKPHHRRMSSDEGSELEVQSFNLSSSQVSAFKSSLVPLKPRETQLETLHYENHYANPHEHEILDGNQHGNTHGALHGNALVNSHRKPHWMSDRSQGDLRAQRQKAIVALVRANVLKERNRVGQALA